MLSDLPRVPHLGAEKAGRDPGSPGSEALQCGGGMVQADEQRKGAREVRVI